MPLLVNVTVPSSGPLAASWSATDHPHLQVPLLVRLGSFGRVALTKLGLMVYGKVRARICMDSGCFWR